MKHFLRKILIVAVCGLCFHASAQYDSAAIKLDTSVSLVKIADTSIVFIADILINGNKKTKPYIIEREIPFKQGQYIVYSDLKKQLELAHEHLINTSLFVDAQVYVSSQQNDMIFINVDVKERWYLFPLPYFKLVDRNFNQWWVENKRSLDRVNYGIKFMQNNVSGRNDNLNIWLITGYNRQVNLKYQQPFADRRLKSGFEVNFLYSKQHELNYNTSLSKQLFFKQDDFVRTLLRAEAAYLYRPAIKTRYKFGVAYVSDKIADTINHLNSDFFGNNKTEVRYPEISFSTEYIDVDNIAYPTKGFLGDVRLLKRGFSENMNMWQLEFHGNYTMPVLPKAQLQFQAAGILRLPFDQPYYNQQLLGYGDIFLRGLEYYVIDGVAGIVGRATARQQIFSYTLKNPVKSRSHNEIPVRFYLKAFSDVGYAYQKTPTNSLLNNRLLGTYGIGLDIVSIYDIVFKIEYSFNQLGNGGLFIHSRSDF
ncbi:MAG: POTRA domain-containing protein [Ilyomonas sp.]